MQRERGKKLKKNKRKKEKRTLRRTENSSSFSFTAISRFFHSQLFHYSFCFFARFLPALSLPPFPPSASLSLLIFSAQHVKLAQDAQIAVFSTFGCISFKSNLDGVRILMKDS
jgi:hypothetical protein